LDSESVPDYPEQLLRTCRITDVEAFLATLSGHTRAIVGYVYFDGLKIDLAAERIGISGRQARNLLRAAVSKGKSYLEDVF
jgi:DNA-directed RNA polymerase specialized sigma24 family protein